MSSDEKFESLPSAAFLRTTGRRGRSMRAAQKGACRGVYNRALAAGDLVRPDHCERCGDACTPEGHHADYDKPLEVEWLCTTCHTVADAERRKRQPITNENEPPVNTDGYLTPHDVSDVCGVHANTVYNWVERGCPYREIGGKGFRFVWDEVDEWLKQNTEGAA